MNAIQETIKERILAALKHDPGATITYCTEWLGYLPFGLYHWVEYKEREIEEFPADWSSSDIQALEDAGFLIRQSFWKNPKEEDHTKTVYRVRGP